MKTRILHTKVWKDNWFVNLSKDSKFLWLYLLSNEKINISGVYELSDREILFDTSVDINSLIETKANLSPKAVFYDGWVMICNVERYNKYRNSPSNEIAYKNELSYVPASVKKVFGIDDDTSVDTSHHTPINKKQEIINKESEIRNTKKVDEIKKEIHDKIKRI